MKPLKKLPVIAPILAFVAVSHAGSHAGTIDFVRDVRPIFENHCYDCHSGDTRKSGLRLDVKSAAMKGGDHHGPDILPGNAKDSPLIHFITTDDEDKIMPPKGGRLSDGEIAILTTWIDEGAVWPDGVDRVTLKDPADHWSFKPLQTVPKNATIDSFIGAKLAENGLRRSPAADPVSLLRRLHLGLTGLPPAPEEVEVFQAAVSRDREAAVREVVEKLLATPQYGERWAQHWLDVVRYADTHGFEVNTERPHAYAYRDYVIDAFNADVPYDRFIREQIAGDALGADAATGFLVTASVLLPEQIGKDAPSMRLARQDAVDEIVANIGQTFLGLSVSCARCHDHKFDPISAREYYGMQAFVAGVEYADREIPVSDAPERKREADALRREIAMIDRTLHGFEPLAKSGEIRPMVSARRNLDRFSPTPAKRIRFTVLATNQYEPCIDELEIFGESGENLALAARGAKTSASDEVVVAGTHNLSHLNDGIYGNASSWLASAPEGSWVEVELAEESTIDRVIWSRDREGSYTDRLATDYRIEIAGADGSWFVVADSSDRKPFSADAQAGGDGFSTDGLSAEQRAEVAGLRQRRALLQREFDAKHLPNLAFAGAFREPDEIRLLQRGDPEQPRDPVPPHVPAALGDLELNPGAGEQERRIALADWIASPGNLLTARVMVNRIWQAHFGTGLVASPNDFGNNGLPPSHPALLDWLAAEFVASGWSVKQMHRLILASETYRQSSAPRSDGLEKDADNRLLWRFPTRRLEAEAIRDSILAVSGRLDPQRYGPGFDLFDQRGGLSGFIPVESPSGEGLRRMIYAHKVRREPDAVFGAFDSPDGGQAVALRGESTTPLQALNLFNSLFTLDQAEALASRVAAEAGEEPGNRIRHIYRLVLLRDPDPEELAELLPVAREHGLAVIARSLFNTNEFLFMP
jgi:hypothetical protein